VRAMVYNVMLNFTLHGRYVAEYYETDFLITGRTFCSVLLQISVNFNVFCIFFPFFFYGNVRKDSL